MPKRETQTLPVTSSAADRPTRVLIVDDHELLRDGLQMLIGKEQDLEVCGEAMDETGGRDRVRTLKPDVVVVDLTLQNGSGLDLIKWIKKHHRHSKTIASTMHEEKLYGERVLRAGSSGFVNKHDPARTILKAIRQLSSPTCNVSKGKLFSCSSKPKSGPISTSTRSGVATPVGSVHEKFVASGTSVAPSAGIRLVGNGK